jgi:hypothetical protein
MTERPSHFTLNDAGQFLSTEFAQSHWGDDHLNRPAVVGLAARALESENGSLDCSTGPAHSVRGWSPRSVMLPPRSTSATIPSRRDL